MKAATNAPTIPPQKRSGRNTVKCHTAIPIITQTTKPIASALPCSLRSLTLRLPLGLDGGARGSRGSGRRSTGVSAEGSAARSGGGEGVASGRAAVRRRRLARCAVARGRCGVGSRPRGRWPLGGSGRQWGRAAGGGLAGGGLAALAAAGAAGRLGCFFLRGRGRGRGDAGCRCRCRPRAASRASSRGCHRRRPLAQHADRGRPDVAAVLLHHQPAAAHVDRARAPSTRPAPASR